MGPRRNECQLGVGWTPFCQLCMLVPKNKSAGLVAYSALFLFHFQFHQFQLQFQPRNRNWNWAAILIPELNWSDPSLECGTAGRSPVKDYNSCCLGILFLVIRNVNSNYSTGKMSVSTKKCIPNLHIFCRLFHKCIIIQFINAVCSIICYWQIICGTTGQLVHFAPAIDLPSFTVSDCIQSPAMESNHDTNYMYLSATNTALHLY